MRDDGQRAEQDVGLCQPRVRRRIGGVPPDRSIEQRARGVQPVRRARVHLIPPLQVQLVGARVGSPRSRTPHRPRQRADDGAGEAVLHLADPGLLAFDRPPPHVLVGARIDQPRVELDQPVVPLNRALDDRIHVQLAGDVGQRLRMILVVHRRGTRDHPQRRDLRQILDQLVGESVGEIAAALIAGKIRERQHRNRRHVEVRRGRPQHAPAAGGRECRQRHDDCRGDQTPPPSSLHRQQGCRFVPERRFERAGGWKSLVRFPLCGTIDDGDEAVREVGPQVAKMTPWKVALAQVVEAVCDDRIRAADQIEEQHADAVDIGSNRCRLSRDHFGRHVHRRSGHRSRRAERGGHTILAGAEIHQDDPSADLAHDVLRLDVAVEQSRLVDGGNRSADVDPDERRLLRAERTLIAEDARERASLDEFHPQSDPPVAPFHAVHRNEVGMADAREQSSFLDRFRFVGEKLERDLAVEALIPSAEHLAKRSAPERFENSQVAPA